MIASVPVDRDDGIPQRDAGVVRAFAPVGPGRHSVVAWTRRHARRIGARVEILVDPDPGLGDAATGAAGSARAARPRGAAGPLADLLGDLFDNLLKRASTLLGVQPSLADRLGRASAGARMLVVPQALPGVEELADTAYEPIAVVPHDPPHPGGPVVLALAARTSDDAIDAAFDAAARRGAPLLVLRLRDPARWSVVTDEDLARLVEDERRYWSDHVAAWRLAYPRVPLEVRVSDAEPAPELLALSYQARLLVLGRSQRGRVVGSVTPSPVGRVIRGARCPVLVVPPPGPPRRHWWPRR